MRITGPIPEHILQKMAPADRPKGTAGMTAADCQKRYLESREGEIQKEIASYLRLLKIEYIKPDMRKRSTLPVGWPDFTLAYRGHPVAIECKVPGEKPRPEQTERHEAMRRNGWTIVLATSATEVQATFRQIDQAAISNGITLPS